MGEGVRFFGELDRYQGRCCGSSDPGTSECRARLSGSGYGLNTVPKVAIGLAFFVD